MPILTMPRILVHNIGFDKSYSFRKLLFENLLPFLCEKFVFLGVPLLTIMAPQEPKVGRMRKGKNFVMQEEKHLCKFMLHVSQESIT